MSILTLDIGSSSVKAALFSGRSCSPIAHVSYPTTFDGPRVEVHAPHMLAAAFRAGRKALAGRTPSALAFTTFSSGLTVLDPHAHTTRCPIVTHQDRRSADLALHLVTAHGKQFFLEKSANLPYPGGIASSSLAYLAQHHPALLKNARVGQVSSLLSLVLTGRFTIDPSNAIFLGLANPHTFAWDPDLCSLCGILPGQLPSLAYADTLLGHLTPAAARALGIKRPASTRIPVVGGFVDTSAAVIQTRMTPGQLSHSAGSTDVLALCLPAPHPAEGILSRPVGIHSVTFHPRAKNTTPWLAVRTIAAAGAAIAWARKSFFPRLSDAAWQRTLSAAAACTRDPALPARCIPTFAGDRAAIPQPDPASFYDLTLATTPRDLLAALLLSLAHRSAHNYHLLAAIHKPQKPVTLLGGATTLATLMHQQWPHTHTFHRLPTDNLQGLALLAQKTLPR